MEKGNYKRMGLMLVVSFVIMYAVMFLNVDESDHIYLSLTRMYMSFLMISPMAVLMLILMKKMYQDKKKNVLILAGSAAMFFVSLYLMRTQTPVGDIQYMKAMIPHHSSAIMTSKNANISDPEVKKLSEQIIKSQEEEITLMKQHIQRLKK